MPIDYENEAIHRSTHVIPQSLCRQLKIVVAKKGISLNEAFLEMIKEYVERNDKTEVAASR